MSKIWNIWKIKRIKVAYTLLSILDISIILFIGWFNNRLIEIITILSLFLLFRAKYEKQFHARSLFICSIYSIIIFYIVIKFSYSVRITIASIVLIPYFITFISYHVRNYFDLLYLKDKKIKNRNKIIKILDGNLTEEHIENVCLKNGLSTKISETVYLYLSNKLEDVADILDVDNSTVVRRIKEFIKRADD